MKVYAVFSIADDYYQPDNRNLEVIFTHYPTTSDLQKSLCPSAKGETVWAFLHYLATYGRAEFCEDTYIIEGVTIIDN